MSEDGIIAVIVVLFIFFAIATVYTIGGLIFVLAWNLLLPAFWHGAPHLTWFQGLAAFWLLGLVQGAIKSLRGEPK